jgi:hypothetical protein
LAGKVNNIAERMLKVMRFWFYVYQDGVCVVKGCSLSKDEAEREANHYAMIYEQDGPVKLKFRKVFSRNAS